MTAPADGPAPALSPDPRRGSRASPGYLAPAESANLSQQIVASIGEGIVVYDRDLVCIARNPFMDRYTGVPSSDVLGRHMFDLSPGLQEHGLAQILQRVFEGETVRVEELIPRLRGGHPVSPSESGQLDPDSVLWQRNTYQPYYDGEGHIAGAMIIIHDVTQSVRDREAIKRSETLLRQLVDNANGTIWVKDLDGRFLLVNGHGAKTLGRAPEDVLGRTVFDLYPRPVAEELARKDRAVVQSGTATSVEEAQTHPADGAMHLATRFPIRDVAGRLSGLGAICADITHLKRVEARLRDEEHRLLAIADNLPAILVLKDPEGRYVLVNAQCEAQFGVARDRMIGRTDFEFFSTEEASQFRANDVHVMQSGTRLVVEETASFRGERRYYLSHKFPVSDVAGAARFLCIVSIDITERKLAEQALAESELRNRTLLNALADGVFVAQEHRFVFANPALVNMLGYTIGEFTDLPFGRVVAPEYLTIWTDRFDQRIAGAGDPPSSYELEFVCKDGVRRIWLELRASRIRYGNRPAVLGVLRDMSVRREAEDRIRALNAELEERVEQRTAELTAANQELESFAYAVSHDLRAPLRAMSGFSEALVEDYGNGLQDEARHYLEQIVAGSRQMGDLIDGLLLLSRSTRGELRRERVDITRLATRALEELVRAHPARNVDWRVEPGLVAEGDPRMLVSVVRNLVDNAWKYSAHTREARIDVTSEEIEGKRFFCVSDNGAGFAMSHAKKLYQPFQRLHRQDEFPGLGVGLATVQRIVHRHGGTILAESAPGKGAKFRVSLPITDREGGAA